ncbi:MAG: DUF935 family protein [bacterium]|nr:DUF935 family protein [bacterium]
MGEILKRHDKPLGASGTDVVGKVHNADDHIEVLQGYQAAQIYDKMRRSEPQVRKILNAIINPIRSATWAVEPVSEEPKDLEAAALIEQILFKDLNFTKFLNEALTMVPHGYSAFEVVHQNKESKEHGQYTGLAQLGFRRQSTITEWCHDRTTGELLWIKQESDYDIQVNAEIPADFLLLFFSEQEGDNIGFPLLRNVYGPYKRKLLATELQYIGIERFAIPTPILKVPKNIKQTDAEYAEAVEVLKGFTSAENSYITYPEGWELELQNNNFDATKLVAVLKNEDEQMASAILASFLELGTGGNTGAYALSADLSDFFFAGLVYYANIIRDTLNHVLIPQLIALNFGDAEIMNPEVSYSGITDNAGKELMEVITGLTGAGVVSQDEQLEDHVRKVFNLPKKAEGEMLENQETQEESNDGSTDLRNDSDDNAGDDNTFNDGRALKFADDLGHHHKGTGPNIERGQNHYHDLLDKDGNVTGRTALAKSGPNHVHVIDPSTKTGKPIKNKEIKESKENPKKLIESEEILMAEVIRRHLKTISDKYIADILRNYKNLPENQKLRATENVKIGGVAKFKKELSAEMTSAARQSLDMAKAEVPDKRNVKLSENTDALLKEFGMDTFKFNDFKSLPKRVQILIASQAGLLTDKEAQSVADSVAFQFNSSEASTNDIEVLKKDLKDAADANINSGAKDTAAANAAATIVNETRNTFLLDPEVQESLASYTFVNNNPKTQICTTLAGTTFGVEDTELVRHQPPLHHNCKSYIRANLKTSTNLPEVTGMPPISEEAQKSITFKDELC